MGGVSYSTYHHQVANSLHPVEIGSVFCRSLTDIYGLNGLIEHAVFELGDGFFHIQHAFMYFITRRCDAIICKFFWSLQ